MVNPERISPRWIDHLAENEVFVFGSNLDGIHASGAAAAACKWGAVWGQGVGLQGQTYAIPTMHGDIEVIQPFVINAVCYWEIRLGALKIYLDNLSVEFAIGS